MTTTIATPKSHVTHFPEGACAPVPELIPFSIGAPGMRSAVLPSIAYLAAHRLGFLCRLARLSHWNKAIALFDGQGGQLLHPEGRAA